MSSVGIMVGALISGPAGALASLKDFYAAFTRKTFVVGDGEEARYLKLVLNSLVAGTPALLAEAVARLYSEPMNGWLRARRGDGGRSLGSVAEEKAAAV